MAGFLVRQLGFSNGDYLGSPATRNEVNPYCSFEQSETVTLRWTWDPVRKCTVAPNGSADLFRAVRNNHCETPDKYIVPLEVQFTYMYNEFSETTWMLQISDFWSGQPVAEAYKTLPRPPKNSDPHFTGTLNILIPPGYQGEPADIDRVHYRALLPARIVEQFAGPILQEEPEEVRVLRGKIRYTRFENTKISCVPIVEPPASLASGMWVPTVMCTMVLKYCVVNGMV